MAVRPPAPPVNDTFLIDLEQAELEADARDQEIVARNP